MSCFSFSFCCRSRKFYWVKAATVWNSRLFFYSIVSNSFLSSDFCCSESFLSANVSLLIKAFSLGETPIRLKFLFNRVSDKLRLVFYSKPWFWFLIPYLYRLRRLADLATFYEPNSSLGLLAEKSILFAWILRSSSISALSYVQRSLKSS